MQPSAPKRTIVDDRSFHYSSVSFRDASVVPLRFRGGSLFTYYYELFRLLKQPLSCPQLSASFYEFTRNAIFKRHQALLA